MVRATVRRLPRRMLALVIGLADHVIPKDPRLWVFPVGDKWRWGGNARAVFERVRRDRDIEAVVLADDTARVPSQSLARAVRVRSLRGLCTLLRAGVIVLHHGTGDCHWPGIRPRRRVLFNVWHGVPLKTIGPAAFDGISRGRRRRLAREIQAYTGMIASSEVDRLAMAASLEVSLRRVHVTGLPRNDWVTCESDRLPDDLRRMEAEVRRMLDGRRLVLYAPTFRRGGRGGYAFSGEESARLAGWLDDAGAAFGVRIHANARVPFRFDDPRLVDCGQDRFAESQILLRCADVLVTDYSSIWVDFLLTGRPIVGFCYDRASYKRERGLLYEYDHVFPGPITETFRALMSTLERVAAYGLEAGEVRRYEQSGRIFHSFTDAGSSDRAVAVARALQDSVTGRRTSTPRPSRRSDMSHAGDVRS